MPSYNISWKCPSYLTYSFLRCFCLLFFFGVWFLSTPFKLGHVYKSGDVVKVWKSIKAASNELGIAKPSISKVLWGKQMSAGGYDWRVATEQQKRQAA